MFYSPMKSAHLWETLKITYPKAGPAVHAFNSNAQEAEAGGSLWVKGQSGLHSETLSQQDKTKSQQNQSNSKTY